MANKKGSGSAEIANQAERIDRHLAAIRRLLRKPLEAEIARGDLTAPQTAVMTVVVRHNGISLKDLSREVSLAHSTVSGIIDRLTEKGLVLRRADPADARINRIYPTETVNRFLGEKLPLLGRRPIESALVRANRTQRDQVEQALQLLRDLLDRS